MRPPPRPGPRMSSPSSAARAAPPRSPAGPAGGSAERSGVERRSFGRGAAAGEPEPPRGVCAAHGVFALSLPLSPRRRAALKVRSRETEETLAPRTHAPARSPAGGDGEGAPSTPGSPPLRRGGAGAAPGPVLPYLSRARRSCAVAVREGARSREPSGRRRAEGRAFLGLC